MEVRLFVCKKYQFVMLLVFIALLANAGCTFANHDGGAKGSGQDPLKQTTNPCWVVVSAKGVDPETGAAIYSELNSYDDVGNWKEQEYKSGNDVQSVSVVNELQYDIYGNMTSHNYTQHIVTEGVPEDFGKTVTYENVVDEEGRLVSFVRHDSDDPSLPGEDVTTRSYQYYDDGTVRQIIEHVSYEYVPNEEPDTIFFRSREQDCIYTYGSNGLIVKREITEYKYDDEITSYNDDINELPLDRTVYTYDWVFDADGSISEMTCTCQQYDQVSEGSFVPSYEPYTKEYAIESDEYGNITRVVGESVDRSFVYKKIENPSVGAYSRARLNDHLYIVWT